jgi:hypothetical protein
MDQSSTTRAPVRRWLACIAILAVALLGQLAIAPPAHSADFYGGGYYPGPSYQGAAYGSGYGNPCCNPPCCNPCCNPCGNPCGGCCGFIYERRVVERWAPYGHPYGYPNVGYYNQFPYGYGGVRSFGPGYY